MSKTFVMGDIHGNYRALKQCLERSNFNNEEDTLIQLGDVVDRGIESYECVEELLTIKNLITIKGNHDEWFNEFIKTKHHGSGWHNGSETTRDSYSFNEALKIVPESHKKFFNNQLSYYSW